MHILLDKGLLSAFEDISRKYSAQLNLTAHDRFANNALVRL